MRKKGFQQLLLMKPNSILNIFQAFSYNLQFSRFWIPLLHANSAISLMSLKNLSCSLLLCLSLFDLFTFSLIAWLHNLYLREPLCSTTSLTVVFLRRRSFLFRSLSIKFSIIHFIFLFYSFVASCLRIGRAHWLNTRLHIWSGIF